MNTIFLCDIADIRAQGQFVKYIDDLLDEVIAFFISEKLIVKSSFCPHFGGEILFDKANKKLRCKWHDFEYCPITGKCLSHKIGGYLRDYEFEIRENKIYLVAP